MLVGWWAVLHEQQLSFVPCHCLWLLGCHLWVVMLAGGQCASLMGDVVIGGWGVEACGWVGCSLWVVLVVCHTRLLWWALSCWLWVVGHPESHSQHGTHRYTMCAMSDMRGPLLFFNMAVCIIVIVGVVIVNVVSGIVVVHVGEGWWWWWCVW